LTTSAETTIDLKKTTAVTNALKRLPESGIVQIDSERFTFSSKDVEARQITIDKRAQFQSTTAAHAAAATVRFIEHEIIMAYGNSGLDAPVTDDTYKPIINLNTSTNLLWDYDEFTDYNGLRAGSWRPTVQTTSNTRDLDNATEYYSANQGTHADPAVEMGMAIRAWMSGTKWAADTGKVYWQLYQPCRVWRVNSLSGEKYRATSSWPTNARLYSGNDGVNWTAEWATEATPTTAATWTAWTKTNEAFAADSKYLRYTFGGTVAGSANNAALIEISDLAIALSTASVPTVSLAAELESTQLINGRITNNTTGQWLELNYNLVVDDSITVDCDNKTAYASNGVNALSAVSFSDRKNWVNLAAGTNALQFDMPNTGNITIATYWRDRNS